MQPFCEWAVSDLDPQRSMHRPIKVAHSSFVEESHMTKNTASDYIFSNEKINVSLSTVITCYNEPFWFPIEKFDHQKKSLDSKWGSFDKVWYSC